MTTFNDILNQAPAHIQAKFNDLAGMRERPDFHPEPSAKHHIEIVVNRALAFGDADLVMAAFFHDVHKFDTMKINPKTGHPTSPGHDKWAQKTVMNDPDVRKFITDFGADPDTVAGLCGQHMRFHQMDNMKPAKQDALKALPFFKKLEIFGMFDNMLISDDKAISFAKSALV